MFMWRCSTLCATTLRSGAQCLPSFCGTKFPGKYWAGDYPKSGRSEFIAQEGNSLVPAGCSCACHTCFQPGHYVARACQISSEHYQPLGYPWNNPLRHGTFPRTKSGWFLIGGAGSAQATFYEQAFAAAASLAKMLKLMTPLPCRTRRCFCAWQPCPQIRLFCWEPISRTQPGAILFRLTLRQKLPKRPANAPVLALYDAHVRQGLVGGSVVITTAVGRQLGVIGFELLTGKRTLQVKTIPMLLVPPQPMFDWVAMRRWGADPAKLPQIPFF